MISAMADVNAEVCDAAKKYQLKRRFKQTWGSVIEDDLALPKRRPVMKKVLPLKKQSTNGRQTI